jgi:hypothetical protein
LDWTGLFGPAHPNLMDWTKLQVTIGPDFSVHYIEPSPNQMDWTNNKKHLDWVGLFGPLKWTGPRISRRLVQWTQTSPFRTLDTESCLCGNDAKSRFHYSKDTDSIVPPIACNEPSLASDLRNADDTDQESDITKLEFFCKDAVSYYSSDVDAYTVYSKSDSIFYLATIETSMITSMACLNFLTLLR